MKLFARAKGFIGIDIGTDSVKMVELKKENGQPTLMTYGMAEESIDIVRDNSPESTQKIVQIIRQTLETSRIGSNSVIAALPTFAVFSSILSLPAMPTKDLQQAVRWEAKKFVPMPLEEMILDWKRLKTLDELQQDRGGAEKKEEEPKKSALMEQQAQLRAGEFKAPKEQKKETPKSKPEPEKKPDHLRVLITAAPKSLVSRYLEIFKQTGLVLGSLETEAFAVARSLIGKQKGSVMIVDIGSGRQ